MENKNKIMIGLGVIAAAFLGKKMHDRRKGSGAVRLFPVPSEGRFATQQEAFFAFKQRENEGKAIADSRYSSPIGRRDWMRRLAPDGVYKAAEFEGEGIYAKGGKADQAYREWQAQWAGGYADHQNSWNPEESSGTAWGSGVETFDSSSYGESQESWSSTPSSSFSDSFGFPDVDAPRFRD
jgi:hypothetical protein